MAPRDKSVIHFTLSEEEVLVEGKLPARCRPHRRHPRYRWCEARPFPRQLCLWIACLALPGLSAPLAAHPVLTFVVTSHIEVSKGPPQAPTDETFPLIVTLGHRFLTVEAKDVRTIYDFDRNRIFELDLRKKTYQDVSLYSNIGFRVLEFYNRTHLGNAIRAAQTETPIMQPALVEHLFSLTDDDSQTVIDNTSQNGETAFLWRQHILMTVSSKTEKLPAAHQAEYWRFMRYYAGGHPEIYASLSLVKGVPKKITVVRTDQNTETRIMTLTGIATPADAGYALDGFMLSMPDREPYTTLKLVAADAAAQVKTRAAEALSDRDSAMSQGRYLDALLANYEVYFSTGGQDLAWMRSSGDRLKTDSGVLELAGALSRHDAAQLPAAADELSSLRTAASARREIIDVFEGNVRLEMGQAGQGESLLLGAARKNPYLTSVWHDLADYYYRSFRMPEAWSCMDAARRVAPDHPILKPLNDLERTLRGKNPEFF